MTRLIMIMQLVGLAVHSMGQADRYDLYFNLEKIVFEGQVLVTLESGTRRPIQIWRLVTCFFFIKRLNIYSFFEIMFL